MLINPYVWAASSLPAPLNGVTTLMFIGASIETQIVGSYAPLGLAYLLAEYGINVTIEVYATAGADLVSISNDWFSTIKPAILARPDGGAGVLIDTMTFGNTITELKPYASANSATLASRKATFDALIPDMKSVVGPKNVNIVNHTCRNYAPSGSCISDQSLGSQPFNVNWGWPQAQLTPWWYQGRPYSDPYPIGYNDYSIVFLNGTDPIHYDQLFNSMLLRHRLDCLAAIIKGTAPPRIPMKANPLTDTKPKAGRAIIASQNTGTVIRSRNMLAAVGRGGLYKLAVAGLPSMDGYCAVLGLGARPTSPTNSGTQTGLGTGVTANTIRNDALLLEYSYNNSADWFLVETITNLIPNAPVSVKIIAARLGASSKIGEWSFDGGATIAGEINAACVAGQVPNMLALTPNANSSGELQLWTRNKAGNTTGTYWNAIEIDGGAR